ncbi:DUF559 domain-containing protein [Nocardia sp. XZ_19_385]|uniref:DUF559 domain-containing protein n=1 Tax=Nocardia sp. XZ_19_385 TaxID=2769488 RepID=UPI00188F81BC|nr:DUF559 domain-containing protein [Nocardia sp. XZ_19_385]
MGALDEAFSGSWAVAAGLLSRWELRHNFMRVYPGVYLPKGRELDAVGRARAAGYWAKGDGVLVGYSAAAMHGTRWLDSGLPAEVARPRHCRAPAGIRATQQIFAAHEVCDIGGFTVTTPARTAFDLGCRLSRDRAVPILDALSAATGVAIGDVAKVFAEHPGYRGLDRLPEALWLMDGGAESPQESRLRLLLIDNGFHGPRTQLVARDNSDRFVARLDMGWEKLKIAVEYDGAQHWLDPEQRAKDIDRWEMLKALGWIIIRVSADHLRNRTYIIVDRVRAARHARGVLLP